MASTISGPGILYVNSKIARTDLINEESYMKWYSEDHIPEIIETSAINSALRWKDVDPKANKPFLVMYPMKDIAFTQGEEFKKIRVHSDLLPNQGPIYDLADIDVRYYGLIQTYDPKGAKPEQDFDDWYRKEHLEMIAPTRGYLRTTRYKLLYYRTNAQSRELKGLPPRPEDKEVQAPPTWLAIHEFDTEDLDTKALMATADTEWSKGILGSIARMEALTYHHVASYGDGKFFHGQ
ncbi:hypothetical protein G7Y89_g12735 [Cudoniella acicularis]|uniref:EthD domain-containing protein n=1 Tax=Cudoniella acicularis TaxID=354080 RepID=A0A8H4RC23_9HELO|nr:hypothetical protein G7Y89_g12735 [Cudoniella acicularis]